MITDTPVLNAKSLLPRRHPSSWMAAGLGLASLVLGPIAGVCALLLTRQIRADIARNRGYLTGVHLAVASEIAAWTTTIAWTVAATTGLVAVLPAATYLVPSLAVALAAVLVWRRQPRWLVGVSLVGGLVATLGGGQIHHVILQQRAVAHVHECDVASQSADAAWRSQKYEDAHSWYRRVAATCTGDSVQTAATRMQYIATAAEYSARAESARLQQATAAETAKQVYQHASAAGRLNMRFAAVESVADHKLTEARRLANAKKWQKASEILESLEGELKIFRDTEISATPRWKEIAAARQTIADSVHPGLSKVIALREAEATRKVEVEARRQQRLADRVQCCDGSLSPSCRYSQGSLRGCCSYHGGVC